MVLYHILNYVDGPRFLDLGTRLLHQAEHGVDLFFVISGFIMVHTTWSSDGSVRYTLRFLCKRLARLWPVYAVATLLFILATKSADRYLLHAEGLIAVGKAICFYPQSAGGPPFFGYAPLNVGWTLNYELWFYLLFGLSLLAGRFRWLALAGLFGAFLVAWPWIATGHVTLDAYQGYGFHSPLLAMVTCPLVWEFVVGAAIGVLYRSRLRIRDRGVLLSFVGIAVCLVLWQYISAFRAVHGMLGTGTPLALLLLALALYHKSYPIRVPPAAVWLGDISYSLYLVHRIVQVGMQKHLTGATLAPLMQGGAFFVASTLVSMVAAYWLYRLVERGLGERLRDWLLRRF